MSGTTGEEKYLNDEELSGDSSKSAIKQDYELFNEDAYVPHKLVQFKRMEKDSIESWDMLVDGKVMFTIKAASLTTKQKEWLRKPEGVLSVMKAYRSGVTNIKDLIKKGVE